LLARIRDAKSEESVVHSASRARGRGR
jgi:hypothetical protein